LSFKIFFAAIDFSLNELPRRKQRGIKDFNYLSFRT
jgi:hypothetical protein